MFGRQSPSPWIGYRQHSCRVEGRRVAGRGSVACPALSRRAAVRHPWARFLPPLSGRVESWRAAGRVTDDYRVLGIRAVATHADPPPDLLITALTAAGSFPQQVDAWCHREEVPPATLHKMLGFADARVAVAAAIGWWCGHSRATEDDRRLPDGWREAILRAPADETRLSQHEEYWLGKIR